ncbi:hypothetical protein JYP46_01275 [Nitratireductor aquimarinus]|uniref:hypothetical protein n=1 Tax=Alphaproteobacteria TaxID=28211 RepID=UPI0019D3BDAD|nr:MULTISPECIES: hypothetical protein [Alphaproteobacteria]MBN7755441.1 hypothetical protein [Nitratireductor aquimarinus]MBY5998196.1 hypothetical protein [Tritonibacter mobilis]MBY6020223.1 hypothetical protein [Nitratireductor sp. DP7N14-4]
MKKLTKAQRLKLIERSGLASTIRSLPDDEALAAHDLIHEIMNERWGSKSRVEAERRALGGGDG